MKKELKRPDGKYDDAKNSNLIEISSIELQFLASEGREGEMHEIFEIIRPRMKTIADSKAIANIDEHAGKMEFK